MTLGAWFLKNRALLRQTYLLNDRRCAAQTQSPWLMTLKITVHRINIMRYESLLRGDLTPYERRYLEQLIEQERSAMRQLYSYRRRAA